MKHEILQQLGLSEVNSGVAAGVFLDHPRGGELVSKSPIDGQPIARVLQGSAEDYEFVVGRAQQAFERWRGVPAPRRAALVRDVADSLRQHKESLARLISLEMGKILPEAQGEVQEMIDMADLAVGQGRMLYGLTMPSERAGHRLMEQWHPLGVVGVISAFNFPVAVYSWNAMLAAVCGDPIIWKPSSQVPLTAIAVQKLMQQVAERHGFGDGLFNLVIGSGAIIGEHMLNDARVPLVSFTGSTQMGRHVAERVAHRLGRTILELGGNNAAIVLDDADLELASRAILFGAVGTAGQRCTSTRRVLVQRGVASRLVTHLSLAYEQVRIGNPLEPGVLMGPLVDQGAVEEMQAALQRIRQQGGEVVYGGEVLDQLEGGCYVKPCIVRARPEMPMMKEETFAPIVYVVEVENLEQAIRIQNDVPQGLSSAIFTASHRSAETFLSQAGSDCGIANVNTGTSGAEIGGAFGGEKETGGGREAGSDAWKQYMRRQTSALNYSGELPLAQGIRFGS